jgi:hypothetical protein
MKLKIEIDTDPLSPREYDNLGTILYTSSRHTLGDRRTSVDEIENIENDPDYVCLPVYAYIHGETRLSTQPFGNRFDSGRCGLIYASKAKVLREFGTNELTPDVIQRARGAMEIEIDMYSRYLSGEVYGYVIEGFNGECVDSCWGFDSREAAEAEGEASRIAHLREYERKKLADLYTKD